ncbi:hypothetical protein HQ865_18690 [Mucilaginibacter mali]|uniref:RiboL-PSP-HEPN domain-containing protein n=1 Tax=Mucilaginibacter mali TaxID=2740462 RepID=A0A7D4Q5I7_9SPHI|nr:hypothetical protein [Mucilaginibacter mali]QKJ31707.1 hypothetical protein HQ865_18690 [Mucilaginibacter mali]
MAKQSLTADVKSLDEVESWYQDQTEASLLYRRQIISLIVNPAGTITNNLKFAGMSIDDVNIHFNNNEQELEHLTCLYLIASVEGFVMSDFKRRYKSREKTDVGSDFRNLVKAKRNLGDKKIRVSLEKEILQIWKDRTAYTSFSEFIALLKYRHWLAHGRNWVPKLGRTFTFANSYKIAEELIDNIDNY